MINERIPQLHVLVADDNEADRLVATTILCEEGCHVTQTVNGSQAKELYEKLHPDLVWLDAYLPGLNGLQVCEQISPHAEQYQVPVLVGVNLGDPATIERAFEVGATHCLPKPFNPATTRSRIRRVLHARRVEKAVQRAKREWEATFDVISDLILLTNSEGEIVRCNRAVVRRFGSSYSDILGQPINCLFYGNASQPVRVFSEDSLVVRFPKLEGWYQVSNYRVPDLLNERLENVHIIHDITPERNMAADLYASEQRFRALVENTSEGIQLVDGSGKVMYASPHIAQMLGYEPDLSGESGFDYIHPDDIDQAMTLFRQFVQNPGASISTELRARHKDGRWVWLQATSRNLLNIAGVEAILVNLRDITERRAAEEKLKASEARYRTLFEDSPVALWEEDFSEVKAYMERLVADKIITDLPAYLEAHVQVVLDCVALVKVIDVNQTAMRMLGARKKEDLLNSLTSILAVDGYGGFRKQLVAIAEGRTYIELESLTRTAEGETRYMNIIWSVWPGYEGTFSRVTVSSMDLTEWRRSEEALRVSRERYELAVRGSNDGIWDWNIKDDELYVSARYKEILGYINDELQPTMMAFYEYIHPEDATRVGDAIQGYLDGRYLSYHEEFRMRHKDGLYRWISAEGVALRDADGSPYRMAGSVTDITERKLAEAKLQADEARYRTLFENSPVALWEEDFSEVKAYIERLRTEEHITDFRAYIQSQPEVILNIVGLIKVLDVNNAAIAMLGAKTKAELMANLDTVLSPEGFRGFCEEFISIAEGRTHFTIEIYNRTLTDEIKYVSLMWSAWPGYEDSLARVTLSVVDLTERQQAEEKLRVVTQAIEQGSTAVIITDIDGNIEYVNPYFTQLAGYSLAEVQGKNPRLLKSGEAHPSVYEKLWATISAGGEWRGELHNKKKNGELYWAQVSISPVFNSHGEINRFLAVQEDVTERKAAEDALAQHATELEEARNLLDAIIESLPLTLFMKNADDLRYARLNKAAENLFGHSRQAMLGKNDFDFFAAQEAAGFSAKDREVLDSRLPIDIPEETILTANLGERILHTRKVPILGADGEPRFLLGVAEDITERKQAEAHLRASEERFKLVTYATNDAVWELDLATRQRWWNAGVRPVFGYMPEQIGVDQSWWEALIHPEDRAKVLASLEAALTHDGQFWSKEYRYHKADGSYAYVFDRGYVIQDEQGRPQRIIGAMLDITERKRAEDALRQSEETFSKAFHASPLPMAIVAVQKALYLDVNAGWESLFKLQRESIIGRAIFSVGTLVDVERMKDMIALLRKQGHIYDYEIPYQIEGEEERILLVSIQTADLHGKASYLITCYDITEQRRLHTAMAASQKLADLGTLAAGVAHEMNSPLQVITGVSQSMLKRLGTGNLQVENLKRNLEIIHRNGWRCAEIVRSLHTYARASGGAPEPADLNALVHDTLLLIEHQLKSWANIVVLTELAPDLPPLTCDHNQITQILINLLTNARDAMPQGGEILISTCHDIQANHLILSIRDSGAGIPDSIRARIFDPFFTTKALGKGSGLGLSIVAGIVRAHGGTIDIESAPHKGTLFTLRFPLQPVMLPPGDETRGRFDTPLEAVATPQGDSQ